MDEYMVMTEECALEISLMESVFEFDNNIRSTNIKFLDGQITEEKALKDIGSAFTKFISDTIEKIKKIVKKLKQKIDEKIIEYKFQKECDALKKFYASNKAKSNGTVKMLDYMKYKKRITQFIKEYHKLIVKISKMSMDDHPFDYLNKEGAKLEVQFADVVTPTPEGYMIEIDLGRVINMSDRYVDAVKKIQDDMLSQFQDEISFMDNMVMNSDNISFESSGTGILSEIQKSCKFLASTLLKISNTVFNVLSASALKMIQFIQAAYNKIVKKTEKTKEEISDIGGEMDKIDDTLKEYVDDFSLDGDVFTEATSKDFIKLNKSLNVDVKGNIKQAKQALKAGNKDEAKKYLGQAEKALGEARTIFKKYVDESRRNVGTMISSNLILIMSNTLKDVAILMVGELFSNGNEKSDPSKIIASSMVEARKIGDLIDTLKKVYRDVKDDDVNMNTFNRYVAKIEMAIDTLARTIGKLKTKV